jgi:riboflavin synthase
MFTGIVEHKGSVAEVERNGDSMRLVLETGPLADVDLGDSISVNGVCLTAVDVGPGRVGVDVVQETIARTNLGGLTAGDPVNLELAMRADGRFDGHIVQGHVDGLGSVAAVESEGEGARISIDVPAELLRYVVEKGSITVDGVSLTVAAVSPEGFQVALIPHSLQVTTLGLRKVGEKVNLEVDVLAKYVERLLEAGT